MSGYEDPWWMKPLAFLVAILIALVLYVGPFPLAFLVAILIAFMLAGPFLLK